MFSNINRNSGGNVTGGIRRAVARFFQPRTLGAAPPRSDRGYPVATTESEFAPVPALKDPKDLKPYVLPADRSEPPPNPEEPERDILDYIYKSYKAARAKRQPRERSWQLCRLFDEGRQHLRIHSERGIVDPRTAEQREQLVKVNMISPLTQKVVALATQSRPDVIIAPLTNSAIDRAACDDARAVLGHCARNAHDEIARQEQAYHCVVTSSAYRYLQWDANAGALVPLKDGFGQVVGSQEMQVGEVIEEVLPSENVIWDHTAKSTKEAMWVIIDRIKPVGWVQANLGRNPDGSPNQNLWDIKPDAVADGMDYRVPNLEVSENQPANNEAVEGVHVLQYLEKPNPKYPRGRYIIAAGKRIFYVGPWPYAKKDKFPLAEMYFKKNFFSPYAHGLVQEVIDLQVTINREWNRILRRLDKAKRLVYVELLSESGPDPMKQRGILTSMRENDDYVEITYKAGARRPEAAEMPPINAQHFELLDRSLQYMQDIYGAVDVLMGKAPPGVTAGVTVDLLQQAAASQLDPFIKSLEQCAIELAEWRIALYAEFARGERMLGIDSTGTPRKNNFATGRASGSDPPGGEGPEARMAPSALSALTSGGKTAVLVAEGSALPQNPAMKRQELQGEYDAGRLGGPPGTPISLRLYWENVVSPYSAAVLEAMDQEEERMAQMQAQQEEDALRLAQEERDAEELQRQNDLDQANQQSVLKAQQQQEGKLREMALSSTLRRAEQTDQAANQAKARIAQTLVKTLMTPARSGNQSKNPK